MSDLLQEALRAKQSGDIGLAKQLLSQALIQNPSDEAAWMMMSDVVEDVKLRRNCLERVLSINPDNTAASTALTKLNTSPLSPVVRGERDKPFNPPRLEKTPPFTPPFTWEGEQKQFLALGDLTYPDLPGDQPVTPAETTPTFDWANESAEPDKAIHKIFDAISNPEQASQPLPDTYLNWLNTSKAGETSDIPMDAEAVAEARYLDELVGPEQETLPEQQPANPEDFKVSSEQPLGLDAFTSPEQSLEAVTPDYRLWDNPKARIDRMVILSNKSIVYASPKATDVPHILGLYAEKKMLRDLLGVNAGMIKLESIRRLYAIPKKSSLSIDYQNNGEKKSSHQLTFSNREVRDEVMESMKIRMGPDFYQTTHSFGFMDKFIPPFVILLLLAFLGWGVVAGIPMLSELPEAQLGSLQVILSTVQNFISYVGVLNLDLILVGCALVTVIWLMSSLRKPSKWITVQRQRIE